MKTHKIVDTNTTLALNSCSVEWSSAKDKIKAAHGAPDKIKIEDLNSLSKKGIK